MFFYTKGVQAMSYLTGIKTRISRTIDVTCPQCRNRSPQRRLKVTKNMVMICPHCGTYFHMSDCKFIG